MKLALGTVQFGLDYGAFNLGGQVGDDEVTAILHSAEESGIDTLDTARAYGTSEAVLGRHGAPSRFRVVTKIRALAGEPDVPAAVAASISASRNALGTDRLDTLLFHSAPDLLGETGSAAWHAAEAARDRGEVRALGVSVYDHEEALAIAARFPIRAVQLPVNIFDQRAISTGALARLKDQGVEIHARSIFLQGFALSSPDSLPENLRRFRPALEQFREFVARCGTTPLAAALEFVLGQDAIDRVVVGVQKKSELDEVVAASLRHPELMGAHHIGSNDPILINPAKWGTI